jgi:hypothetical protein
MSHVILAVDVPAITVERVVGKWADRLKASAQAIDQNRRVKIPDEVRFQNRIGDASTVGFQRLVAPDFVSRSGLTRQSVVDKQVANLKRAFKKYARGWDYAFATVDGIPAKRFQELVESAREDYSEGTAARTLGFTGTRLEAYGPAPLAALWLTGDPTTLDHLRAGDQILAGGPYRVCPETKKPGLKAMLNQRLIQTGATIVRANFAPAIFAVQNQLTAEQVQGFVDPALDLIPFVAGGDSHVDYIIGPNDQLYLEIKVSKM